MGEDKHVEVQQLESGLELKRLRIIVDHLTIVSS
ncbi:hypothetical protein LSH36_1008g01028 [Paralvinella palmiformis]|uniref:Uncharacterized protein n=1 Tax=Paralvinella palmiformis TaxID=53620 RepID=A0AAD9IW10_9ANNE|nr:hypothetical protein LSH36_1008g01028 [Paralvinella palmiformis]